MSKTTIINGDSRQYLAAMAPCSIDSIVTDPPYGLVSTVKRFGKDGSAPAKSDGATGVYKRASTGFMGQRWDGTGIEQDPAFWRLCWDVLKPGGHLLAFGGTRTWHRIACAIEDAGFEVRDSVLWLYGTGFPKSHDVAVSIDKAARGVPHGGVDPTSPNHGKYRTQATEGARGGGDAGQGYGAGPGQFMREAGQKNRRELTGEAAEWQGWGTALKPAVEPIIVARKPLIGTVAQNVLAHGTGALNIDGCRVGAEGGTRWVSTGDKGDVGQFGGGIKDGAVAQANYGRWPANVLHDGSDEVEDAFAAFGESKSGVQRVPFGRGGIWSPSDGAPCGPQYGDNGTASRFFYGTKASKNDRGTDWQGKPIAAENKHPTVKPTDLMRWLVRLVTPPGGVVLDPFAGSGSTGKAARMEGFRFIGIEADPGFAEIARQRAGEMGVLDALLEAISEAAEARRA